MNARRIDQFLCVGVMVTLALIVSSDQGEAGPINRLAYLWAVGLGLLMLVRRRHPMLVLLVTVVGFFAYYAAGFPAIGVAVPIAAALYSAAEMGHPTAAAITGLGTLSVATGYRLAAGQSVALVLGYELATHLLLIAAVIGLGHSVRSARRLRRRTDQVNRLLHRQRAMDADARHREDQLSLARDLHDSIGHALTVAALHTEIARESVGRARHDESLAVIRASVSDALSHLRRTVGLLRGGVGAAAGPGIRDLPALAQTARSAGYEVHLDVGVADLPGDVETAVFRLVQEGITNTLKHSNGRRVDVSIRRPSPDALTVTVLDNGIGADDGIGAAGTGPSLGHGLGGMRERIADLGGELDVTSGVDGWRVRATIPLEAVS